MSITVLCSHLPGTSRRTLREGARRRHAPSAGAQHPASLAPRSRYSHRNANHAISKPANVAAAHARRHQNRGLLASRAGAPGQLGSDLGQSVLNAAPPMPQYEQAAGGRRSSQTSIQPPARSGETPGHESAFNSMTIHGVNNRHPLIKRTRHPLPGRLRGVLAAATVVRNQPRRRGRPLFE